MRTRLRRLIVQVVALTALGLLGGCQADQTADEPPLRTDPRPLIEEFPLLGGVSDVHRQGGRRGDDRVPDPSTYVIRAALTLSPADLDRLTSRYAFAPASAGAVALSAPGTGGLVPR